MKRFRGGLLSAALLFAGAAGGEAVSVKRGWEKAEEGVTIRNGVITIEAPEPVTSRFACYDLEESEVAGTLQELSGECRAERLARRERQFVFAEDNVGNGDRLGRRFALGFHRDAARSRGRAGSRYRRNHSFARLSSFHQPVFHRRHLRRGACPANLLIRIVCWEERNQQGERFTLRERRLRAVERQTFEHRRLLHDARLFRKAIDQVRLLFGSSKRLEGGSR